MLIRLSLLLLPLSTACVWAPPEPAPVHPDPIEEVEPRAGVRGTILQQDGRPLTGATVEILGEDGGPVAVDASGAFEFGPVRRPYDLRVVWPLAENVHVFRMLEEEVLELRPFHSGTGIPQQYAGLSLSFEPWSEPATSMRAWLWTKGQQLFLLNEKTGPGSFSGNVHALLSGSANLRVLAFRYSEKGEISEFLGQAAAEVHLELGHVTELSDLEFSLVETTAFTPMLEVDPQLSLEFACTYLRAPGVLTTLTCSRSMEDPLVLPVIAEHESWVELWFQREDGARTRLSLRNPGHETMPTPRNIPAPPRLVSPVSPEGVLAASDARFRVDAPGTYPLTYTFERDRSFQAIHVTTTEREISLPDLDGQLEAPSGKWRWRVSALPEVSGADSVPGYVLTVDAVPHLAVPSGSGPIPALTKSATETVHINW